MLFNSYVFWAFFACVITLYKLLPHRGQNYLLLIASYVFYGYWDWRFLFVMLFSTVVDYFAGIGIGRSQSQSRRKMILVASVCVQLGLLGLFKYYGFFSHELGGLFARLGVPVSFPTLDVLLPVGISFYTFQTMSYTIDVYRGQFKYTKNFIDFALFVSFFPHLVAGPIVRASKLLPQISSPRVRRADDFRDGLYHVTIGLFKKAVVADNLGVIANLIFRTDPSHLSGVECLVGVYAFAFQIYGDFSGYSQIAQGLARWMNIDLTTNFNLPYFATSPSDFWSRWHISLSTWFRDYVFVPLARGGRQVTRWRTYFSVIVVMLLSGLWHGAGWTFLAWGLFHGLLLCGYRFFSSRRYWFLKRPSEARAIPYQSPASRLIKMLVMFHLVCFGWLLFRAASLAQAFSMLGRMASDFRATTFAVSALLMIAFYAGPLLAYEFWLEQKDDLLRLTRINWAVRGLVYTYCAFMLWFFPPPVSNVFIYFQF
jgi:alginate O-acetyltransferase complex protein AlgI